MSFYKKLIKVVRERWSFVLIGYILGYIASLWITGIPSLIYLIPFKYLPIMVSAIMATGVYHAAQTGEYLNSILKSAKPLAIVFVIFVILMILHKKFKFDYGIDISPFVGL